MSDDGVREHHGVTAAAVGGTVRLWETDEYVHIRTWNGISAVEQPLTPVQARYLADRLYDLARRIEQRQRPTQLHGGIALAGAIGGHARAASLTPERRREIAKKASDARWGKAQGSAA